MSRLHEIRAAVFFAALVAAGAPAMAADPSRGRAAAVPCQVCHGRDGVAVQPLTPNLAGQPAQYLAKALKDYRDGRRDDPQMTFMARSLTDEQIADLAAWYAAIEVTVSLPEE